MRLNIGFLSLFILAVTDKIDLRDYKMGEEDSIQLAEAIAGGTRIIIMTLQKFPSIIERFGEFSRGTYGIIIDKAHSSQDGKASCYLLNR